MAITSSSGPAHNILWDGTGDIKYRNALKRLVAYCWISEDHLKRSIDDPLEMMKKIANYVPPHGLILRLRGIYKGNVIITKPAPPFDEKAYKNYAYDATLIEKPNNGWKNADVALPTEIIYTLPPKPGNVDINSFALADFEVLQHKVPTGCC